jgi:hypothetical protein
MMNIMYKKNLNNDYSQLVDFLVSLCDAKLQITRQGKHGEGKDS